MKSKFFLKTNNKLIFVQIQSRFIHRMVLHLLRSKMTPTEVANAGRAVEVVLS